MIPWILKEIGYTIWLLLPPYIANSSAVLTGGKTPIDFGKKFIDGKRIFGDGKTWRGLFGGACIAGLVSLIQWGIGKVTGIGPYLNVPFYFSWFMGFCFGIFALIGDLIESFFKRRANIPRGAPLPLADQLDFLLAFYLFAFLAFRGWFVENFPWDRILIGVILTPALHYAFNYLGYLMGKKEVPW